MIRYRFIPLPDITTYELAQCMVICLSGLLQAHHDPRKELMQADASVRRHFQEEEI